MKTLIKFSLSVLPLLLLDANSEVVLSRTYPPITPAKAYMYIVRPGGTDGHCIEVSGHPIGSTQRHPVCGPYNRPMAIESEWWKKLEVGDRVYVHRIGDLHAKEGWAEIIRGLHEGRFRVQFEDTDTENEIEPRDFEPC